MAHSGAVRLPAPSSITPNESALTNFSGLGDNGNSPSDANLAAGPSDVVEAVNTQIAFYITNGTLEEQPIDLHTWFNVTSFLTDPKVVYDYANSRFILLVDTTTSLLVSVSQQNNATGTWCNYTFPIVSGFADFPELGVSSQGIFFSVNIYGNLSDPSTFTTAEVFAILGTSMEKCRNVNNGVTFTGLLDDPFTKADSVVPVVAYTPFTESNVAEYFINSYTGGGCNLNRWVLNSKTKSLTTVTKATNVPCYSPPPNNVPQAGSSIPIWTDGSNRLTQATYVAGATTCVPDAGYGFIEVAMANGYDWGDGLGTVAVATWYSIDAFSSGYGLLYSLTGGDPGYWFFYPAETSGIMVYDVSNSSMDPTIGYTGILSHINCGGPYFEGNTWLMQGNGPFNDGSNPARWGDYQSAFVDPGSVPNGLVLVWLCGQYAAGNNTWGTQIAAVSP